MFTLILYNGTALSLWTRLRISPVIGSMSFILDILVALWTAEIRQIQQGLIVVACRHHKTYQKTPTSTNNFRLREIWCEPRSSMQRAAVHSLYSSEVSRIGFHEAINYPRNLIFSESLFYAILVFRRANLRCNITVQKLSYKSELYFAPWVHRRITPHTVGLCLQCRSNELTAANEMSVFLMNDDTWLLTCFIHDMSSTLLSVTCSCQALPLRRNVNFLTVTTAVVISSLLITRRQFNISD